MTDLLKAIDTILPLLCSEDQLIVEAMLDGATRTTRCHLCRKRAGNQGFGSHFRTHLKPEWAGEDVWISEQDREEYNKQIKKP